MIDLMIKSSLIVAVAAMFAALFNRQPASFRHMIWTAGLLFALIAPLSAPLLPAWQVELVPIAVNVVELPQLTAPDVIVVSPTPAFSWRHFVFYVWLVGAGVAGMWLLAGVCLLAWVAFHAKPLRSENWLRSTADISRSLRLRRSIRLFKTDRSHMMGAWGIFRGRVLLPCDAESWPEEKIRVVLIHELAHIKRHDWPIQIIAECARSFYWFNPLFWLMCNRLRRESEHACDDIVLGLGVDAQNYAGRLLELARAVKSSAAWSAVLPMAQRRHLERRFQAMLNPSLHRRPVSAATMIVIAVVALCISLPLVMVGRPSLVLQASRITPPEPPVPPPVPSSVWGLPPAPPPPPPPPPPPLRTRAVQLEFGSLSGTAYDPSGAVVSGVTLLATNLQTKVTQTIMSNAAGDFVFQRLPAADYSLQADLPGFATSRIGRIAITANQNVKQNVTLVVGNINETVVVMAQGPPKPATLLPAGTPRRIRVGGNVTALRMISQVKPEYPAAAMNAGVEGTVSLQAMIGTDGSVQAVRVLSSIDADLTAAAVEAVKQWRFSPTLLNGVPVETLSTIDVQFKQPQQ